MRTHLIIITTLLFAIFGNAKAQSSDSTELANLSAELDELFANEADSLSLFSLIDSLLAVSTSQSGLSFRLGYSSRVTTAGRDFGVDQQGLSPGISYYHKSGLYGDITGIWNSELDPKYYLTVATIGFLGTFKKNWAYGLSYDHTFYHSRDSIDIFPLVNAISTTVSYDFKHLYSSLNYAYNFGDESAHQLTWNLTGVIRKKGFKPFKSISILPTFSILWGNQTITTQSINSENFIKNLTNEQIIKSELRKEQRPYDAREILAARLRAEPKIQLKDDLIAGNTLTIAQQFALNQLTERFKTEENNFGLLNYYVSLPISFSTNKFNILVSYNYNIPNELPDSFETETESNGYFGFTLSYNIGL